MAIAELVPVLTLVSSHRLEFVSKYVNKHNTVLLAPYQAIHIYVELIHNEYPICSTGFVSWLLDAVAAKRLGWHLSDLTRSHVIYGFHS